MAEAGVVEALRHIHDTATIWVRQQHARLTLNAIESALNSALGGDTSGGGGGAVLLADGANASFDGCAFERNYASRRGGAIFADYGTSPAVERSLFAHNSAGALGGARVSPRCVAGWQRGSAETQRFRIERFRNSDSLWTTCFARSATGSASAAAWAGSAARATAASTV